MKNIEKMVIVLSGLWLITQINNYLFNIVSLHFLGPRIFYLINGLDNLLMRISQSILPALVQIGIGIWLFQQARRDERSRWVWGLFGLTFGINAAILYFLMQLIEQAKIR